MVESMAEAKYLDSRTLIIKPLSQKPNITDTKQPVTNIKKEEI
jgi:hypothetical protein